MSPTRRIGLIVPSSNVTMETELPELFRRYEAGGSLRSGTARDIQASRLRTARVGLSGAGDTRQPQDEQRGREKGEYAGDSLRFTFHSARMRMTSVTPEALAAMNAHGERCAAELADAECDVLAYACLVAVMVSGPGTHQRAESTLRTAAGGTTPVVTSAGALIDGIHALGAERVAMITPYAPPLTAKVIAYLADAGIEVVDSLSRNITDNCAVGRLNPASLPGLVDRLDLRRAEALVLSACVQMPSLDAIPIAQALTGLPTLSAATATTRALLKALNLDPVIPGAGALLSDLSGSERARAS